VSRAQRVGGRAWGLGVGVPRVNHARLMEKGTYILCTVFSASWEILLRAGPLTKRVWTPDTGGPGPLCGRIGVIFFASRCWNHLNLITLIIIRNMWDEDSMLSVCSGGLVLCELSVVCVFMAVVCVGAGARGDFLVLLPLCVTIFTNKGLTHTHHTYLA